MAATLVVTSGAAGGRSASGASLRAGPSVVSTSFVVEACANDTTVMGGGCDESSESNLGGFSDSVASTENSKHGDADLTVTIVTLPTGLLVTAIGSGNISSNVGAGTGTADTFVSFTTDIDVGTEPIDVAVSGSIEVSGPPCTDEPASASVGFGDGSGAGVECVAPTPPDPPQNPIGQSIEAHYTASAGSTITLSAALNAELFDETGGAHAEFDLRMVLGCTHVGSAGPDTLTGTAGPDTLCGLGGNDLMRGLGGDDFLLGGDGDDQLFGGPGEDQLDAEAGTGDLLFGGRDDDLLFDGEWMFGGSGDDSLVGGSMDNQMYGCGGADGLFGGGGGDGLIGGHTLSGLTDQEFLENRGITGVPPSEVACSTSPEDDGADTITGDNGRDSVHGGDGNDRIRGGKGRDRLAGGPDNDRIRGDENADKIFGEGDNDTLLARDGVKDTVRGGPGFDRVKKDRLDAVTGAERFL